VLDSHVFQTSAQRDPVATVALRTQTATVDSTAASFRVWSAAETCPCCSWPNGVHC